MITAGSKGHAQDLDLSITDPDDIAAICGGDMADGEPIFAANCAACHAIGDGAENAVGPHLYGLFGRRAGVVDGFAYSDAMLAAGAGGMIWERATLHAYLTDPQAHVPGTTMNFDGIADELTRMNLLTYMRVTTTPPPPAPGTLVLSPEVLAIPGDIAYGEYLAGGCIGCHQLNAQSEGVPKVTGWPIAAFVTVMHEYRLGARANQVMQVQARGLDDEEIASLAAYFAQFD
jgi:cytochrome c